MKITDRKNSVIIKEYEREINGTRYKFNATYWPEKNAATFSVQQRYHRSWAHIHIWRVQNNAVTEGVFHRK